MRTGLGAGIADLALNFPPGLIAGLLLKWNVLAAVLLGGVTYISSSGVIAKVLAELRRLNRPETPSILSVLVIEDLAMAVYLPLIGVLLTGEGPGKVAMSVSVAIGVAGLVLLVAIQCGPRLSRLLAHESDEVVLLTAFGVVLLVAGVAEAFQVSAAIGAFLVGIAVSGPIARQTHRLLAPLRDLFAAIFFLFFGLQIDPATLPPALPFAIGLGGVTAATKIATGYWAAGPATADRRARLRAGMALVSRGEFSIVIAPAAVRPSNLGWGPSRRRTCCFSWCWDLSSRARSGKGYREIAIPKLEQISGAEKELQLGLRGFGRVGAVDAVALDVRSETFADCPFGGFGGIGRAHDFAETGNGVFAFERQHDDRPFGHEFDQSFKEWPRFVDGVKAASLGIGEARHAEGQDLESGLLNHCENFARLAGGDSVWFDGRKGAFHTHKRLFTFSPNSAGEAQTVMPASFMA